MKIYKNKKRGSRKLIGDTVNVISASSTLERGVMASCENYPQGKFMQIHFKDELEIRHTLEMNQIDALKLFNSIAEFIKK